MKNIKNFDENFDENFDFMRVTFYVKSYLTSSKENKTPPIGAPKATETPAAEAADNISRFLASFRPYLGNK